MADFQTVGIGFAGATGRRGHVKFPNDQKTVFDYFGNSGDNRLKTIDHLAVGSNPASTISRHDYTYLPQGNIKTWDKKHGANPATRMTLGYDLADQLTSAVVAPVANPSAITSVQSYQYDKAGNRTSHEAGGAYTAATFNNANQITAIHGLGKMRVAGTTDEPAKVKVNGQPATVTAANFYEAWVSVTAGTNTLTVEATDYATPVPNTRTKSWTVNVAEVPGRSFTYDANGNMLTDGFRTYEWDAEDRLVKITTFSAVHEFVYDYASRRVAEKVNGTLSRWWVWDGTEMAEERYAAGTTVRKRYFSQGEERIGGGDAGNYYYTRDHLGSIREMTSSTAAVRAKYEYNPYGTRTKLSGDLDCDFGFTGHFTHEGSGLVLALYRGYDPELGRWLSADPIGEAGGMNLYGYVGGNPLNYADPLGLCEVETSTLIFRGAALVSQADSPAPGPADVIAVGVAATGGVVLIFEYYGAGSGWPVIYETDYKVPQKPYTLDDLLNGAKPSRKSGKEKKNDVPEWGKNCPRDPNRKPQDPVKDWLNDKYGPGGWRDGPKSEYNQLVKWLTQLFKNSK